MPVKVSYKIRSPSKGPDIFYKTPQGTVLAIGYDNGRCVYQWREADNMLEYSPQEWIEYCMANGLQQTEEPEQQGTPLELPNFDAKPETPKQHAPCAGCGRTDVYSGHSCLGHENINHYCARCFKAHLTGEHDFDKEDIRRWMKLNDVTADELAAPGAQK